jgi:trehalose-6-phosphate synthase
VAPRKLIVVSNRGPVSFERDDDGGRVARRGGGGLATALRGLIAHHDVTWIASAMTDEDRAVVAERGGGAIDEVTRSGAAYRLRLLALIRQRTTATTTTSRTARSGSSRTTCGG